MNRIVQSIALTLFGASFAIFGIGCSAAGPSEGGEGESATATLAEVTSSSRTAPPSPSCSITFDCSVSSATMTCTSAVGTIAQYRQLTTGAYVDYATSSQYGSLLTDNYKACATSSGGVTCQTWTQAPDAYTQVGGCDAHMINPKDALCHRLANGLLICVHGGPNSNL